VKFIERNMEIVAKVTRGKNAGVVVRPHLHKDGMYVVSKTRFESDYIRVASLGEVATHIAEGYSVRMSNPKEGVTATSLISSGAITVSK
jgi:hypothetical protein